MTPSSLQNPRYDQAVTPHKGTPFSGTAATCILHRFLPWCLAGDARSISRIKVVSAFPLDEYALTFQIRPLVYCPVKRRRGRTSIRADVVVHTFHSLLGFLSNRNLHNFISKAFIANCHALYHRGFSSGRQLRSTFS